MLLITHISMLSMPTQELNLFCTLCTTLFALGCLVLSIINGAPLLSCIWAWPRLQSAKPKVSAAVVCATSLEDLSSASAGLRTWAGPNLPFALESICHRRLWTWSSETWGKQRRVNLVHVGLVTGAVWTPLMDPVC